MKEVKGNVFTLMEEGGVDAVCITTNGIFTSNGAVMGKGIALTAKERWPDLPQLLATSLQKYGNHTALLKVVMVGQKKVGIVALPTKHHWRDPSPLGLVKRSSQELRLMADRLGWEQVLLPRPGCANGGLSWTVVKPVIEEFLDDRFTVVTL